MSHSFVSTQPLKAAPHVGSSAVTGWALAGLSLSTLLSALGMSVANVGLPVLAQAFAASFQDVQWVVLAYLLASTTLIVGAGQLGDRVGRRRLLLAGIALFTLASGLCSVAPRLWLLTASRALQGLGAALMLSLSLSSVGTLVPQKRIGSAMGLLGTMSAVGTALGPSLGGGLLAAFGWRAIFLLNLPLGMLTFHLARRFLPKDERQPPTDRSGFDTTGTLLLALTLGAYALAMTPGRGQGGWLNAGLLLMAGVGFSLFVRFESKAASPLVEWAMVRDRGVFVGLGTNALVSTVMMATLVVGPFYLSRGLALAPALVGVVMSVGPLAAAGAGVPAGRLVDRFGTRRVSVLGLVGTGAGAVMMVVSPASLGVAGYVMSIVVMTVGYASFQAANNTAVMAAAPADKRGVMAGLLTLARNLGLITGASAMGAVFVFGARTTHLVEATPDALVQGMRLTFGVSAGLIAAALAMFAGERGRVS